MSFITDPTLRGRIIGAGNLFDNNGDDFTGLLIEVEKPFLQDHRIPLYDHVSIVSKQTTAEHMMFILQHVITQETFDQVQRQINANVPAMASADTQTPNENGQP